jgi:hypothetical protein
MAQLSRVHRSAEGVVPERVHRRPFIKPPAVADRKPLAPAGALSYAHSYRALFLPPATIFLPLRSMNFTLSVSCVLK